MINARVPYDFVNRHEIATHSGNPFMTSGFGVHAAMAS